ncbi:MAG: M28 family peptidase [Gemmatimonadota bacterium]
MARIILRVGAVPLCVLSMLASCRRAAPPTGMSVIDGAVLRAHVYALAHDSMQGRAPADEGYARSLRYAEAALGEAGLLPFYDDEPFYRQAVPLVRVDPEHGTTLRLRDEESETTLVAGDGFEVLYPGRANAHVPPGPPVFVGYGIHAPEFGWDDFKGLDLRGRIAMFIPGLPEPDRDPAMPDEVRAMFADRYEADRHTMAELVRRGAAGVLIIPDGVLLEGWDSVLRSRPTLLPAESYGLEVLADLPVPGLLAHPSLADRLVTSRGYDPFARQGAYQTLVLETVEVSLEMEIRRQPVGSANLLALIPGTDPVLSQEYVVLGAHLDHLGTVAGVVYNGANDDASGAASVLEIARALALHPPARSVVIALFTAKEVGHYGSLHFVEHPVVPLHRIVAEVQLERLGRVDDHESCRVQGAPSFEGLVRQAGAMIPGGGSAFVPAVGGEALRDGDHYSFHLRGVPWLVLDCGWFADRHRPTDDADRLDYGLLTQNTRMAYSLVRLLAE